MSKDIATTVIYHTARIHKQEGKNLQEILQAAQELNLTCAVPLTENEIEIVIKTALNNEDYPIFQDCQVDGIITMIYRDDTTMVFRHNAYEFMFTEISVSKGGKLKAMLNLSKDKKYLLKTEISLAIHLHRERFIKAADDKGLDQILVELEGLVRKQLIKEEKALLLKSKQSYIMTDIEKAEAIKFLAETKDILYRVIDATNRMGVVGEEIVRLTVYLCFTSRIIKEPLSMTVKGESSSGKSFSSQNVQRLIPEEGYHFITRATQNAFYHLPEDGMQHKIIYINELPGSETADYSIRSAQSEGDLILMLPIKDPNTGNMETVTKRVKGPVGFLITTTKANMFDENETRNFSVFSDDSPELTRRIGDITIRKAKGEVFELSHKELNLWRNIQRLLKSDLKVIIPYADEILGSFPVFPVRVRRDRERFRILINVVTILHQTHRKIENGTIYSTLDDCQIAKIVGEEILIKTIFESSPAADMLAEVILQMEDEYTPFGQPAGWEEDKSSEFTFTYQDLADKIGWDKQKVKKWIGALTRNGMVEYISSGGKGVGRKSVMRVNRAKQQKLHNFLPNITSLLKKYPCDIELFYNPITGEKGLSQEIEEDRPF